MPLWWVNGELSSQRHRGELMFCSGSWLDEGELACPRVATITSRTSQETFLVLAHGYRRYWWHDWAHQKYITRIWEAEEVKMLFSLGRAFWNACVPPRMSFFLWLTCVGKTLITVNLGNRGMCREHEECGYWLLISSSTTWWLKNCGHWFFCLSGVSWVMSYDLLPWWSFYHVAKDTLAREVNGTIWKGKYLGTVL